MSLIDKVAIVGVEVIFFHYNIYYFKVDSSLYFDDLTSPLQFYRLQFQIHIQMIALNIYNHISNAIVSLQRAIRLNQFVKINVITQQKKTQNEQHQLTFYFYKSFQDCNLSQRQYSRILNNSILVSFNSTIILYF